MLRQSLSGNTSTASPSNASQSSPENGGQDPTGTGEGLESLPVPEVDAGSLGAAIAERLEGLHPWLADHPWGVAGLSLACLLLVAAICGWVTRFLLLRLVTPWIERSENPWDDALVEHRVFLQLSRLAPALVVLLGVRAVPYLPPPMVEGITRLAASAMILFAALAVTALMSAAHTIYRSLPVSEGKPIKGYLQVAKLVVMLMAGVLILAVLADRSPLFFITGLGAMTAVVLLIFRDTILSLVASIQIASNDMVRLGDWIEMPKYGADGTVVDIALHTVKVQNWDKTITTIPTYKLIDDSFKNWRGMTEAGGRRVKRSLAIDMTSVRFLDDEEAERFRRFRVLTDYIDTKREELAEHNRRYEAGEDVVENARRMTNIGTFRAYVAAYLRQHPGLHHDDMTFLVRQLSPGPEGLPIEIYVFSRETRWVEYEQLQADIFDHLLAILPAFDLRLFQRPIGFDLIHGGLAAVREKKAAEKERAEGEVEEVSPDPEAGPRAGAGRREHPGGEPQKEPRKNPPAERAAGSDRS